MPEDVDLVARLRADYPPGPPRHILLKAADEIERLRGVNAPASLRGRCGRMVSQIITPFRNIGDELADITKMADLLFGFVVAEVGRSASTKFENSAPLCLYFEDDASREEFIEAFKEAKPNVVTRKLP